MGTAASCSSMPNVLTGCDARLPVPKPSYEVLHNIGKWYKFHVEARDFVPFVEPRTQERYWLVESNPPSRPRATWFDSRGVWVMTEPLTASDVPQEAYIGARQKVASLTMVT